MSETKIKKIPYGISDYVKIASGDYYYVDKTPYLKTIENAGDYLFFIRPRRFGKSLFLSLLSYYYDLYYKDRFEELFKGTWIYDHPTPEQGKYLVLPINFSRVSARITEVENTFFQYIQTTAVEFLDKYKTILSANDEFNYYREKIKKADAATDEYFGLTLFSFRHHQVSCNHNPL